MQGFQSLGCRPAVEDDDVAHVSAIRLPKKRTAFTDAALRRELVARIESARPAQTTNTRSITVIGSRDVKRVRWCGASPLELERAAWRERRRLSR